MTSIREKLVLVPSKPGCYLYKDEDGNIIYVGKAKRLDRRLKSYFNKIQTGKTLVLVSNIADFEYIVTNTEVESLILEISLIKKYNPKYNILLKDDKTYPYIELTNEKYPKLKIIRIKKRRKTKNKLFGPYPNVTSARETVELINRVYPLRKCNTMKKDLCLYYHIHECLGYCKYEIKKETIDEMLKEIINVLNGDYKILTKKLEEEMLIASKNLNYEKALKLKNEIDNIKNTVNKQIIVSNVDYNFDVFGSCQKEDFYCIETLIVRKGIVIGRFNKIFDYNEYDNDMFIRYIIDFYEKFDLPKEIVIPDFVESEVLKDYFKINIIVPQKGDIKKILALANLNAEMTLKEKIETLNKDKNLKQEIQQELKEILKIDKLERIELFDNSHLFGTYYVGAMVVYENMEEQKSEYRKYKISIDVKDDLKAMQEVIYRRYYKVLLEDLKKPDLIVVDGGELQVQVVKEVIDSLNLNIKIIGLKKDLNHRTNIIINDNLKEIELPKNSKIFLYLTKMQDEVHRFAISYHRDIRSKGLIASMLDNVSGIGEKRKNLLLKKYGSIKKIQATSLDELKKIIPEETAKDLKEYLDNYEKNNKRI